MLIWSHDETPSIDCGRCGDELVAYPNGNAPLDFTLSELVVALIRHRLKRGKCSHSSRSSTA